ncbi:pheromone A receptor-domain-containing protein, partial [Amylocystis lapponica]
MRREIQADTIAYEHSPNIVAVEDKHQQRVHKRAVASGPLPSVPLFPIFAFIGFVLALVPLPWHFEAWNSATCYYMIWASLACLNQFVNSVVWANNALNPAPIWCDISTRIIIGASVGLPAASLCINRRLYNIARVQTVMVTAAEVSACSYVVQGHRFNIYEDIGCYPAIYNTLLAYFLVNWWPIVLGLISAVYCILSLRAFALRRAQFKEFLSSNNSSLSFSRYFRLMALATTELMLTIPISSYAIYLNATAQPLDPWVSWWNTHWDFSRVEQIPSIIWRMDHELVIAMELGQWLNPLCALIFFAYFGVASEARKHYKMAFWAVARRLGFSPASDAKGLSSSSLAHLAKKSSSSTGLPEYALPSPPRYNASASSFGALEEKTGYVAASDTFGGRTDVLLP